MNLQSRFNSYVRSANWWHAGDKVVVAVSTGVDSMTLLFLLMHLPVDIRPTIIVAYVDHQLRAQSHVETRYINDYCQSHSIKLEQAVWRTDLHPESGIESAARRFRYHFFQQVLDKDDAQYLLTAHHGDDLIETVLMKLTRGGQLPSLVGIHEARGFAGKTLIRPLLGFSKQQIREFAASKQIKWYEDATNQELSFERNRIRHKVVPLLKQENPQLLAHVHDYSIQLSDSMEALATLVEPILTRVANFDNPQTVKVDLQQLKQYPKSVGKQVMQQLLDHRLHVPDVSMAQLAAIIHLIDQDQKPQAKLNLANHWRVQREYQTLIISKEPQIFPLKSEKSAHLMVILDRWYSLNSSQKFGVFSKQQTLSASRTSTFYLDDADLPLQVRSVEPGDRVLLPQGRHQKVTRVLINAKISNDQRKHIRVLVTNRNTVLSVLGVKNSVTLPGSEGAKPYLLTQVPRK
ncbi:tRNA lysidine(34) synthetase TilS [Lentilactobacillus kefiri]|uniref:tRNA lysidine(34) synthetase TilS n=1 Tax=Lentilactobacillus kefiri TaxID=33962 RepID=UPI0012E84292|nr:tRNA lysidine(34) synthetase TilS [Lentilactobacillus kefiri]QGV23838.1 tRNA lysidine(34) synthetase TilS [Lentilactobacillus kefiri]